MAKRYYNLERETKALLKRWGETRGTLPDAAGIARVNEYILRKKGLGELVGGIAKRATRFVRSGSQYLTITDAQSNNAFDLTTDFTMSAWCINTGDAGTWRSLFSKVGTSSQRAFYTYMGGSSNQVYILLSPDGLSTAGVIKTYTTPTNSASIGSVLHITFTFTGGVLSIYLNGAVPTITKSSDGPITSVYNSPGPLSIGAYGAGTQEFASGLIGNAFISTRAITAAENSYLYNSGLGRSYLEILAYQPSLLTSMVSYWPLNEGSGTRRDWHSTNHLTAVNNPLGTQGIVEELF